MAHGSGCQGDGVGHTCQTRPRSNSAIEAEAFRRCLPGLAAIDQLLTSHASRRDKSLQSIAFFREMKARQRQLAAKSAVGNGGVPRLEHHPTRLPVS